MTPELGCAAPGAHGSHVGFCTSAAISDTAMRGSGERALRRNALPGIPGIAQVPFVFLNVLSRALLQGLVCSEGTVRLGMWGWQQPGQLSPCAARRTCCPSFSQREKGSKVRREREITAITAQLPPAAWLSRHHGEDRAAKLERPFLIIICLVFTCPVCVSRGIAGVCRGWRAGGGGGSSGW